MIFNKGGCMVFYRAARTINRLAFGTFTEHYLWNDTFEMQDVFQHHHVLVEICGSFLTPSSKSNEGKVVQLPSKRCKRGMVEIPREDFFFETLAIMDYDPSTYSFRIVSECCGVWDENLVKNAQIIHMEPQNG